MNTACFFFLLYDKILIGCTKALLILRNNWLFLQVPLARARLNPEAVPIYTTFKEDSRITRPELELDSDSLCEALFSDTIEIVLPTSWSKLISLNSDSITFANFLLNKHSSVVPYKEIQVTRNGNITYICCGRPVKTEFDGSLSNVEALERTIAEYDSIKLSKVKKINQRLSDACQGSASSKRRRVEESCDWRKQEWSVERLKG